MFRSITNKGLLRFVLGSILFLMSLCIFWLGICGYRLFIRPMSRAALMIRIEPSMSAYSMVRELKNKQLISSERLLLMWISLNNWSSQLKTGIYQLKPDETVASFIRRVIQGDVWMQTWRISEGSTQWLVENQLKQIPYLTDPVPIWSRIAAPHPQAEGLLWADTYQFPAGSSAQTLINQAHTHLLQQLHHAWEQRDLKLPYKTPYELLIAASIIEKEASVLKERRLISGIIVNRLRRGMPLQMDPIVLYGLGPQHHGVLKHHDLSLDSPYNAYRHRGLPPTPIAMIGSSALDAAAHPLESAFLYFVAKGDGTHYFSVTYDEQRAAIRRLRKGI